MNPRYQLLVAAAALSLGACSTDDTCTEPVPENEGYKISFTVAEDTDTRTTLEMLDVGNFMRWVPNDKVGIYTVGQNMNSNISTTADVSKSPVEFVGTLEVPVSSGDMFYAYYPYNAEQSTDPTAVKLSIPAEQKQTQEGVYNGESHPLVAVPMEFAQEWDNGGHISSVRFRQLGAIVELLLYSSDETLCSESICSVTFESETPLAGDFSLNLKNVTVKDELPISEYESKVVTTLLEAPAAIPATKDEAARVYLTIAPGQYIGQIVVKTNLAKYTFRLKNTMDFKRGVIKGLPADLAKAEREIIVPDASIHFADTEVKRICVENWDGNSDGELSYKEAANVTSIGSLFRETSISIFNEFQHFTGLQSIEQSAFLGCNSLTSITIPNGVITIGINAFSECSNLTNITIPDGVTSIGDEAFAGCSGLTSIDISQTVSSIGTNAFIGCSALSAFKGKYASADHRCLILDGTLFAFARAGRTEYTIPDGVTAIGGGVFGGCTSLTSIHIPDGVITIGNGAFNGCSSLTSINIPNGVTSIEAFAFYNCCSLSVYCKPTTPPTLGNYAFAFDGGSSFNDAPPTLKIYVPAASVEKYKTAVGWFDYASNIFAE